MNLLLTDEFKKSTSYITQDDRLQLLLTVAENMKIAADLKLGNSVSKMEKNIRVGLGYLLLKPRRGNGNKLRVFP